jgi:hypothetical protein
LSPAARSALPQASRRLVSGPARGYRRHVSDTGPAAVAEAPAVQAEPVARRAETGFPGRALSAQVARLVGEGGAAQADGVLTPDHVLDMQKTVGNRATTRFLDRAMLMRDPRPVSANDDAMFGFSKFTPTITGTVTATPIDDKTVDVTGPHIDAKATAWVNSGKTLPGGGGYVGFVQNLVSSDRTKIYRAGGEPAGVIVAEIHGMVGKAWDAFKDRKKPGLPYTQHKPFYGEAKPISDTNIVGFEVSSTMYDEPGFVAETKYKSDEKIGYLTEVTGQDKFKLALAVEMADKSIVYLQGLEWTLPWAAKIDKAGRGTGGTILTKDIPQDKLKAEGPDPNLVNWSLDEKEEVWQAFSTMEQARVMSTAVLLTWLPKARAHDKTSEQNIIAALKERDAAVTVTITCTDEADEIMGDIASASVKGTQMGLTRGNIHIAEDESATLKVKLTDLYGSIEQIPGNAQLTVEMSVGAEGATGTASWGVPFAGSKEIKAGGATYNAAVTL